MDPAIDYGKIPVPILFTTNLSNGAKLLFVWYMFRGNSIGVIRWSYTDIANEFHINERTVRRYTSELEFVGLVRVIKADQRGHEIAVMPFTAHSLRVLNAPIKWAKVHGGSPVKGADLTASSHEEGVTNLSTPAANEEATGRFVRVNRQICPTPWGGVEKSKLNINKTGADPVGSGPEVRTPFDEIFEEPLLTASKKPAPSGRRTTWSRSNHEPQPTPVVDDILLAKWTAKNWANAFVAAMRAAGYDVAQANRGHTIQAQMTGVTNFMLERVGRMDTYKFLVEYFPKNFPRLCEMVFHKSAKDLSNFPVSWMENRLGELVERYKTNKSHVESEKADSPKGIKRLDWLE